MYLQRDHTEDRADSECTHSDFFFGWEPMIFSDSWCLCQTSFPASVTFEGGLSSRSCSSMTFFGSPLHFGVEEESSYFFLNLSVIGSNRSNIVFPLLFLAQRFCWRTRLQWMVRLCVRLTFRKVFLTMTLTVNLPLYVPTECCQAP